MAFWIALVYRGARSGGLQESQTLALEQGVPFFPNDFPDTPAGKAYNAKLKEDGEAQYKRYPPAKRPNYEKLGVKSPFSPPWKELVEDWNSYEEVSGSAANIVSKITSDSVAQTKTGVIASGSSQMDVSIVQPFSLPGAARDAPMDKTGDSTKTNIITSESAQAVGSIFQSFYVLRSRSKLNALRSYAARYKQRKMGGSKLHKTMSKLPAALDDFNLSSIVKSDPNSLVCVQLRMVNRSVPVSNSAVAIPSTEDTTSLGKCRDFAGPVEPLHKGPKAKFADKSLRNSCTREIMGFVSSGHYSLSRGCGFGVAFCALPGLVKLLSSTSALGETVVLVRGPSTQQYRFAHLIIL